MMRFNPELQRNIWMEMTPGRLVMMPAVIAAVFYIAYLAADGFYDFCNTARIASYILFALIVIIWGGKQVSDSVIAEVNDRTWDSQRMNATGPFAMAAGKLFGSAAYCWYGGLICICAAVLASLNLADTVRHLKFLINLILLALFSHTLALSFSLMSIRKQTGAQKINNSPFFLTAVMIPLFFGPQTFQVFFNTRMPDRLKWFAFQFLAEDFLILTLLFFLAWSVTGLYRNMRTEFQMENGPWVWGLFLLSLMIYYSGFIANIPDMAWQQRLLTGMYAAFAIALLFIYLTVFAESKHIVDFRFLVEQYHKGEWTAFLNHLPLWAISLGVCLMVYALTTAVAAGTGQSDPGGDFSPISTIYLFNLLCFMLRDITLVIHVNLRSLKPGRADFAALFYLLILYALIPVMMGFARLTDLLPVFLPIPGAKLINGTVPVLTQFIVILALMLRRWRSVSRVSI